MDIPTSNDLPFAQGSCECDISLDQSRFVADRIKVQDAGDTHKSIICSKADRDRVFLFRVSNAITPGKHEVGSQVEIGLHRQVDGALHNYMFKQGEFTVHSVDWANQRLSATFDCKAPDGPDGAPAVKVKKGVLKLIG